ncbi:MAG: response regulator [Planctomycetota bacterium]|jgi:two-component system response regulator NreC
MKRRSIRVLCVDDHAFLAEGLKTRMSLEPDLEFVGWLETAENLVDEARRSEADVVLLDIEMPGPDPFEALEDLHRQTPDVRTLMLSAYVRDHYIDQAVQAGAWGYLSKSDSPDAVVEAIRKAVAGQFALGPDVLERCGSSRDPRSRAAQKPKSKLEMLTPRETQILRMIGRGLSRTEIAAAIHRSPKTVDNHRAAIMQKLGIHDRVELARYAISEGLAEL